MVWSFVKSGNFSHPVLAFYGLVVAVWAAFMLEYWKRLQSEKAVEWGMTQFESTEVDRPEFLANTTINKEVRSPIDGKNIVYFPKRTALLRARETFLTVLFYVLIVIGIVGGIYRMKYVLQAKIGSNASTVASIVNAVAITITNMIYQILVRKLTG